MSRSFDPEFEYSRGPVLWAWAATVGLGVAVLFLLHRPSWVLPAAFAAGGVAGARSGFYDQSANNGFVGVLLGVLSLLPTVMLYRLLALPTSGGEADALFFAAALATVDLLVYGPLMLIMGYLGAVCVDAVRRRVGGPIGY